MNPRSTRSPIARPSSDHSNGTVPVTWNQTVPHGRPQASPMANGRNVCPTASVKGTGSSGTSQAEIDIGTVAR